MASQGGEGSAPGPIDAEPARDLRERIDLVREDVRKLGPLTINPPARTIRHNDGRSVTIEPRAMQVLVALLQADGRILAKDDLIASCWDGRIVGDDSLSSVVYRLRRDLGGIADGVFDVETITKVGFRITRPSAEDGAFDKPETGAAPASVLRRRWPIAAALLVLVLTASAIWWLARPGTQRLTVALERFEAAGGDLPPGLAASLDAELREAFGERAIAVTDGAADLLVSGTVRRIDGDRLRFSARVADAASGVMLWSSGSDRPIADGEAQKQFATGTAGMLDCALDAMERHGARLTERPLSLTFQACAESGGYDRGRQMIAARRLVREAPDFWLGWHLLAYAIGGQEMATGGIRDPALTAEAEAAARRVIELQPGEAEGYTQLALALSPQQPGEREALLRQAVAANPEECACAIQMLGDFLLQAGRIEEAASLYQRAVDQNRTIPLALWRLAMSHYLSDRPAAGDEALRRAQAIGGESPRMMRQAALWAARWTDAAGPAQPLSGAEEAALADGLAAMATGDPARIAGARAALVRLPARRESELRVVPLLAALGDTDAAFERLEAFRASGGHYAWPGRMPGLSRPLLFDPLLRPLWFDPRFPAFLERAGFIAYWRQSGSRPDICASEAPPAFCQLLSTPAPQG